MPPTATVTLANLLAMLLVRSPCRGTTTSVKVGLLVKSQEEGPNMPARTISAAVCTALALTLASASPAIAHGNDNATHSQYQDPTCTLRGTNGDDYLNAKERGLTGPITICGFGGNDTIIANDAGDTLIGGPGNDTITGGAGADTIEGQGGSDIIFGGLGPDDIRGDTSDDRIYANDEANTNDNAADKINGGGGNNDTCYYSPTNDTATNCEVINPPPG